MNYDINRPWLTLDDWQKEYINTNHNEDCFLLCGRQVGKTTAMSIKAVELCLKHYKKGDYILICSITEKQGYHLLAKCLAYAQEKYISQIKKGKDKPTMHKINFKNGTGILSFAAGETGEGLRGYTIKKLMIDEGSRMSDEFFIAVSPMLSVIKGSMDIASTPCGKTGFFYKCSLDKKFKKFYVSAEDCPRHTKEFLDNEKERLSKLAYAQEYLAVFTDELKRLFSNELINETCINKEDNEEVKQGIYYLGVDVAGLGRDETTFEVIRVRFNDFSSNSSNLPVFYHCANFKLLTSLTIDTSRKIFIMNQKYNFKKIGVDDAGVGFGVWSELMNNDKTKRKTIALNNASRKIDKDGEKSKKLLKEEMYFNLLALMENKKIVLLDDEDVKASLASIQYEVEKKENRITTKIWGSYSHITEGIIRAVWLAEKEKGLNIPVHRF
jgi:hypothetical protein